MPLQSRGPCGVGRAVGDRSKVEARRAELARRLGTLTPAPEGVRCGFCSKRQSEVSAMFEGPGTFICNECVMLFAGQLAQRKP